jgi:hypothetical protein
MDFLKSEKLTVWASAKISSLLANVYVVSVTVLILSADDLAKEGVVVKAAAEPAMRRAVARENFIVTILFMYRMQQAAEGL